MNTPTSPGWYPAPDGDGEQWWNGSGWSDSRRGTDAAVPGLPGYQAAPPSDRGAAAPPPPPSRLSRAAGSDLSGISAIVFGVIGVTVFSLFAVIAIIVGLGTLRSNTWVGRILSLIGIALGVVGVVLAIAAFVQSGMRDWGDLIF